MPGSGVYRSGLLPGSTASRAERSDRRWRPRNRHRAGCPRDKRGAELLFQVLTEREEKASVAIATNESFSGWTKTFTDPRLCAAIVDRLTFQGTIIETGTDSYRLAHTVAQQAAS